MLLPPNVQYKKDYKNSDEMQKRWNNFLELWRGVEKAYIDKEKERNRLITVYLNARRRNELAEKEKEEVERLLNIANLRGCKTIRKIQKKRRNAYVNSEKEK